MKRNVLSILAIILILTGNAIRAENLNPAFPSVFVADPIHEFEPVVDGTQVFHEFMIQNRGEDLLIIENVKTD